MLRPARSKAPKGNQEADEARGRTAGGLILPQASIASQPIRPRRCTTHACKPALQSHARSDHAVKQPQELMIRICTGVEINVVVKPPRLSIAKDPSLSRPAGKSIVSSK